jgi:hypothetical protein
VQKRKYIGKVKKKEIPVDLYDVLLVGIVT